MSKVAGVDGCRGGWLVVLWDGRDQWECRVAACFREVLEIKPRPAVVAVDMPVGLLDQPRPGGRVCDQQARRLLGFPRRNSVFSPPARSTLWKAKTFLQAKRLNKPVGITIQTFNLFPKLREADEVMSPELQRRVKEIHPELCFHAAWGRPMQNSKLSAEGRKERIQVLESCCGPGWRKWYLKARNEFQRTEVGIDDLLDASIAAWSAKRILNGNARRLPGRPLRDRKGLNMEIWF